MEYNYCFFLKEVLVENGNIKVGLSYFIGRMDDFFLVDLRGFRIGFFFKNIFLNIIEIRNILLESFFLVLKYIGWEIYCVLLVIIIINNFLLIMF